MRQTFKGFLKAYCAELAGKRTTSLRKLRDAAASDAPRVAEPLFLLALEEGKLDYLLGLCTGTWMEGQYRLLANRALGFAGRAEAFLEAGEDIPARYRAVLDAYRAKNDARAADLRIVSLMRSKTLEALGRTGLKRYGLCKALGLNAGNVYAYLAGDDTKVSRATARRIMEYALATAGDAGWGPDGGRR